MNRGSSGLSIRQVAAGGTWVSHELMADLLQGLLDPRPGVSAPQQGTLTRREAQIVSCIADGATNKEIAEQFGLREQTVKNHLSSIFRKMGVANRLELAVFAVDPRRRTNGRSSS